MALRKTLDEADEGEPTLISENVTAEEYFAMPETMQPHNLIEGRLYVSPSPFWKHQEVTFEITAVLRAFARTTGGRAFVSPMDCKLPDGSVLQPDTGYISAERKQIVRNHVMGAPDLVVEVLSRGTRRFDRTRKLAVYARNGVREAWLIDHEAESVTLFFGDGSRWVEETSVLFGENVPSRVVDVGDAGLGQFKTADD
jgi:Uma2 family endonuclease